MSEAREFVQDTRLNDSLLVKRFPADFGEVAIYERTMPFEFQCSAAQACSADWQP